MRRIVFLGLLVLMSLSTVSCLKDIICVYPIPDNELESVWVNDTDKDCTVQWFYMAYGKEILDTVQIGPGDKYSSMDYYNSHMLYHARRISFSFSGEVSFETENPNSTVNGGWNWWDSLPKSSFEILTDKSAVKTFYLSDVLDLAAE